MSDTEKERGLEEEKYKWRRGQPSKELLREAAEPGLVLSELSVKLAGGESQDGGHQKSQDRGEIQEVQVTSAATKNSSEFHYEEKMVRSEVEKDIPMCVSLPIEIISADRVFPFLNTTLADLGIDDSSIKEHVVWVDSKRTQVRSKSGKLKEKEVTVLEVRVKAQHPGNARPQEVLYSTESHTDRSYCRSGIAILPWTQSADQKLQPLQMMPTLDTQSNFTREKTE
ncbi:uncharacterized protein si:ch211-196f5.2 [Trichomycterus rosablanca]|uniref:uncharacterized protein si:ch211-196f5.2 n=1 Tax=Trichomycterus rosablanca TaxID=2290929 RepID=UPI002F351721